ncbi:MAG: 3-hydroxyacyl-ACP dehydratase FabZ [Acidobacteria bacterium]|nr:3-hydroxyacyl-ACP dehydratase FabZ [Acidobacteriota bacterium]MCB9399711.1 3-hydroxyacyl-ACP dehydratase FabZ [Acidobacteriota bacterium]
MSVELFQYLKHRYPFLLIDRIIERKPGISCTALKNVSVNEKFFTGHFGDHPILPGVLLIEMMAQCAALVGLPEGEAPRLGYLAQVQQVKFLKPVFPGDQLLIHAELEGQFGKLSKFKANIMCEGSQVVSGNFTTATKS